MRRPGGGRAHFERHPLRLAADSICRGAGEDRFVWPERAAIELGGEKDAFGLTSSSDTIRVFGLFQRVG